MIVRRNSWQNETPCDRQAHDRTHVRRVDYAEPSRRTAFGAESSRAASVKRLSRRPSLARILHAGASHQENGRFASEGWMTVG